MFNMCISIWFEVVWPFVAKPLQTFKEQRSVAFNSFEAKRVAMIVCIQIQSQRCLEMKLGKIDIVESSF